MRSLNLPEGRLVDQPCLYDRVVMLWCLRPDHASAIRGARPSAIVLAGQSSRAIAHR